MWCVGVASQALSSTIPMSDIAALAEQNQQVLVPDEGAPYDEVHEIDLSTVRRREPSVQVLYDQFFSLCMQLEPLVNGPFTPDLANPISQLGKNAKDKGWPTEIKVGKAEHTG